MRPAIVRHILFSFAFVMTLSCATPPKEIVSVPVPQPETPPPPHETIVRELPPAPSKETVEKPVKALPITPVMTGKKSYLKCGDDTKTMFNSCGIDALPFIRTAFYDIDDDGMDEMIAGSKDGTLRLYRNYGTPEKPFWKMTGQYFDGITAGAFSSPAIGDIDNDGRPEVLVGSGGFSTASGIISAYKNSGTISSPVWRKVDMPELRVGNDATPALADIDNDGKPDIISGNSTGNLILFRNRSSAGKIIFEKDKDFFRGIKLGMYTAPTATMSENKIVIIAGNDMGKLYLLQRSASGAKSWSKEQLKISFAGFASPVFVGEGGGKKRNLVVSENSGGIYYFSSGKDSYTDWEKLPHIFAGRILAGQACAPSVSHVMGGEFMMVGNMDGELRLFEYRPLTGKLPWTEKDSLPGVAKLPGYSRAVLAEWQGKYLLITGQLDGKLRAFLNSSGMDRPKWVEQKEFFRSLPLMMHAAPAVFDLDEDGKWELIVGDVDGVIRGFRYSLKSDNKPVWEEIPDLFSNTKVARFSSPALFRDSEKIYLLSGQQDGRIVVFISGVDAAGRTVFRKDSYLEGVRVNEHSSPSATNSNGNIGISVGDYSGNLKHFVCRNTVEKVTADMY